MDDAYISMIGEIFQGQAKSWSGPAIQIISFKFSQVENRFAQAPPIIGMSLCNLPMPKRADTKTNPQRTPIAAGLSDKSTRAEPSKTTSADSAACAIGQTGEAADRQDKILPGTEAEKPNARDASLAAPNQVSSGAKVTRASADRLKKNRAIFKRLLKFDRSHRFHPETNEPLLNLIGTDEVGRGCLAGPVVAAAVILPDLKAGAGVARALTELNDSKKLNFLQREKLANILQDMCMWAVGEASPAEINTINILQASLLAMRRAIDKLAALTDLSQFPVLVLVDGNKSIKELQFEQKTVVDGDAKSASIAAASIIAKVYRDRLMIELSESFPAFNWHQNKGYGSLIHRQALREHGMTEWHRTVFCQKHLVEQLTMDSLLSGNQSLLNEDALDEDALDELCDDELEEQVSDKAAVKLS
jgi:ribonuclease HII